MRMPASAAAASIAATWPASSAQTATLAIARQGAKPRQFGRADDLIADQDVGDAAPGEHFGLGHLLHAVADRAARHLQPGDDRRLVRLGVRPQFHARRRQQRRHRVEVVFERIEVDDQSRRVDFVFSHAGNGGGRLQHRRAPSGPGAVSAVWVVAATWGPGRGSATWTRRQTESRAGRDDRGDVPIRIRKPRQRYAQRQ